MGVSYPMAKQTHQSKQISDKPALADGVQVLETERVYKGTQEIDHDLFKLNVAKMQRNASYTDDPIYIAQDHSHIYHTVDSSGTPQENSAEVGGHYHKVTAEFRDGKFYTACSPPLKSVVSKRNGAASRRSIAVTGDDHTHVVEYKGSQKIRPRALNTEYVKFQSSQAAAQSPAAPADVLER